MKKVILPLVVFLGVALLYFGMATGFHFHPKWALDYFNELAASLLRGHIFIDHPSTTYDLIFYRGHWYAPWGILAAVLLIPAQLLKGRFIPPIYLSVLFASANVVLMYGLLRRVHDEFFPALVEKSIWVVTIFFAFGTMNFYVGTLGSAWHVDQMVSSFFGNLSLYIIFKRYRAWRDYFFSVAALVPTFLGHATLTLLSVVPAVLCVYDLAKLRKSRKLFSNLVKFVITFGVPLGIGTAIFFLYNYLRFGSIWEYGYRYIHEAPNLADLRMSHGVLSLWHLPNNFWHFALEIPAITWQHGLHLGIDLYGNSIFFLSPPLIAILLASPVLRYRRMWRIDPYVGSLWLGSVITFLPSLLLYSTGWMQFGYRYALDIMMPLVLLSVFGVKGKVNGVYTVAVVIAIVFHILGIQSLM